MTSAFGIRHFAICHLSFLARVGSRKYLWLRGKLPLLVADERVLNRPVLVDEEDGGSRDVPGVQAHAVPDPICAERVAALVDQDVEGEPGLFDVAPHGLPILREDPDDLDPPGRVSVGVGGELTEPVAALRSPRASVKVQKKAPSRQEVRKRAHATLLIDQREPRRAREW